MKKVQRYFIIDFDSTIIKSEPLEELAKIVLKDNAKKAPLLKEIKIITKNGMEGKIGFYEELSERLKLLKIHKKHIKQWINKLQNHISTSVLENQQFFKKYRSQIYIISGAFKECILPIVKRFDLLESHVFANTFRYNEKGEVIGVDDANPLSQDNGKVKVTKALNLSGEIYVVGDGHTDYLIKKYGLASKFVAFTENVYRKSVVDKADYIVSSFQKFINLL